MGRVTDLKHLSEERDGPGGAPGNAVRYLLTAQARYITGHPLVVDGGATLVGPARSNEG